MLGLGHAILSGEPLIGDETFAVILADDLCDCEEKGVLSQMIEIYQKYQCSIIAIKEISMSETNKYGVIDGELIDDSTDLYRVTGMVEKPDSKNAPTNMGIIGRYILTPDIFEILRNTNPGKNGEIQITDALLSQAKKGSVIAYKFNGNRFDCGSIEGYLKATNYFAKQYLKT